ncbi:MAG: hypothetical protein KA715_12635 [Xanthomonadaceae bacterium]|nr:hypothetical protein [Xanthomonadaceae bacterium]
MSQTRLVRLDGKMRKVVRIHSSGLATQYSIMMDDQVIPLSDDYVNKHPESVEWLLACQKAFDDTTTFGKPHGENRSDF